MVADQLSIFINRIKLQSINAQLKDGLIQETLTAHVQVADLFTRLAQLSDKKTTLYGYTQALMQTLNQAR